MLVEKICGVLVVNKGSVTGFIYLILDVYNL